jgi:uncharacterized protein YbgA (DUF1722 family)
VDHLKTILATLSAEEQKELGRFIGRQKQKKGRKDLELYRLLLQKQDFTAADLVNKLYPEAPNVPAYHALRKRLFNHLADFILLKRQENDPTAAASVRGMLSLAGYLFEKRADQVGWNVLRKAEKLAETNEQYDLLNAVYTLQIEHAQSPHGDPLPDIVAKYTRNKARADEEERAGIACGWVNHYLREAKARGGDLPFEAITGQVLAQLDLAHVAADRPKLMYQLLSIARGAVLVRKDFYAFEPYLVGQYEALAARGAFGPRHGPYKTGLLYMIAQTQYRNRKFAASLARLGELRAALAGSSKADQQQLGPRCTLLWAMNHVYLGKNDEAVAVLEKVLEGGEADDWPVAQGLNARINLAFCYFQRGDFARANRLLLAAGHSDRWNTKKMGLEWTLRKNLSEIIIQYELGNVDLVLNKVRSIERNFDALLRSPVYANVRTYLQFIRQLTDRPGAAANKAFSLEVAGAFRFLPVEQEDLQAMSFYAWLKSKMLRRDYYSVLLELVG